MSHESAELLLRGYHAFVAGDLEAIEAMLGDRAQREPELLARHWFAAGEGGRAEFYWLRARHRAAHWQEQLDALADYLESADGADQLHPAKLH